MNETPEFPCVPRAPKGGANKAEELDLSGTSLGRYLLLRRLGKGGMGVVYEAEDNLLNRRVAVKLLPHGKVPRARTLERFFVEAQVAARLNHSNIIGIFDLGERSGNFYIVMELLNELSLGGYLRKHGPLPWPEATRIAADCCAALHEAHLAGLVHRDISSKHRFGLHMSAWPIHGWRQDPSYRHCCQESSRYGRKAPVARSLAPKRGGPCHAHQVKLLLAS